MLRNYYYLNRTITELNKTLQNADVDEIYSQEKNSILLSIPTEKKPFRHLFISTNPSLPYLLIKNEHHKARKNILQFDILTTPQKIQKVEIARNDRLIRISLEKMDLVFSIMGGKTNIYFIKNGVVFSELKQGKGDNDILARIENNEFTSSAVYHPIDENLFAEFELSKIKKQYSFIPKELIAELKLRYVEGNSYTELFHQLLRELYEGKIKVFESITEEKIRFVPESFNIFSSDDALLFNNCNSAILKFLQTHFKYEKTNRLKKEITKHLSKEMEKVANRLNNLKGRVDKGNRSDEYYNLANLLLANRHSLHKGMRSIAVTDYTTNKEVAIKLNPKKNPQQLIDAYFEKAHDEKINFRISQELFEKAHINYNKLKEIELDFTNAVSVDEYTEVKKRLKISDKKDEKRKVNYDAKLREYLVDNKYRVLVGRDSKSNDMLSIKIAKQNDYWFHARGLPGSHVVLRVENTKEVIPKSILKNVAQLAAFYSKAKTAGTAPVSYTLAKFVRKKKGMEPGKVLIEKEKVLLVRPGIPSNTILVTDE